MKKKLPKLGKEFASKPNPALMRAFDTLLTPKPPDPLKPSAALLCKLGSIIVHLDEMFSPTGHAFDKLSVQHGLQDPEVVAWLKAMGPYVPVKR